MTVEVVPARQREAQTVTADTLALWRAQADELAQSDMVPSGYRGRPANIVAAAMIGSELGWTLTRSLLNIHAWETSRREKYYDADLGRSEWRTVTEPVTALSAPAKLSLLTTAGHGYAIVEHSATVCSVVGERCDRPCACPQRCTRHYPVSVSIRDDDVKHLVERAMWQRHPKRMLWWRTVSELVAVMCPEVVMGMTGSWDCLPAIRFGAATATTASMAVTTMTCSTEKRATIA